jgi:hypothetical protein
MDATITRAAAIHRALGRPARLAIIDRLADRPFSVDELAVATSEGLTTVRRHVTVLEGVGLVRVERNVVVLADPDVLAACSVVECLVRRRQPPPPGFDGRMTSRRSGPAEWREPSFTAAVAPCRRRRRFCTPRWSGRFGSRVDR